MLPDGVSATIAYQRLRLQEIRDLYGQLDLVLDHYLNVELGIANRLDSAETEAAEIRDTLSSLGVNLSEFGSDAQPNNNVLDNTSGGNTYKRIEVGDHEDFEALAAEAESYLSYAGVNLQKDPLLQVIGSAEVAGTIADYRQKYGDISWNSSDYLAVVLAGCIATLLDIFLVKIPADTRFLGKMQPGSPLAKWLKEHSAEVHDTFLKRFEQPAKVPYDDSANDLVEGLSPKTHRLMSLGHDPTLGFIFGVADVLGNTGTYINKYGDIVKVARAPAEPVALNTAFLKVFLHLLSDVSTSAGIQPPFFTILQLIKTKSPFVLGPSGEEVTWTNVARYMYVHGYDLRHFATTGIVPATVDVVIRGWRLLESYEKKEDPELTRAKTASMLMLGHTVAMSGNLLKTGIIYRMNPLAMNWAQALRMFPVTVSWFRESIKRDLRIRDELDAGWSSLYQDYGRCNGS